jgi:nucleotide-binding universal stress UspA family protein
MTAIQTILVATDFSGPARVALDYGRELAHSLGATLHVLHVVQEIPTYYGAEVGLAVANIEQSVEAAAGRELEAAVGEHHGLVVRTATTRALNVAAAINEYATAHDVDLIVAGTHGRGVVSRLLMGSVAERLVRTATRPVLTVRAEDAPLDSTPERDVKGESTVIAGA